MLSLHVILLVTSTCLVTYSHACSLPPGATLPTPHTMEETFNKANTVVHARASSEESADRPGSGWPAYFSIKCVFKDTNNTLPANNTVVLDYELYHSCMGEWPTTRDAEVLIALKKSGQNNGKFIPDEPAMLESAAFEATPERLERVLKVCGMQHPWGDVCPG